MYKRRTLRASRVNIPVPETVPYECDHKYHPLSYYLNGGADPTGEHLDLSRVTMSDSAEDISAGCGVDARCDPRTSMFDLYEQIGSQNAQNSTSAMSAGEKTSE